MSKRTTFTSITPLPASISRQTALAFLQNHLEMIDLNPLVKERHRIQPPAHASADERNCVWYSLTDEISYLPGASSAVSYTCAFHDLPGVGLQTHCYAPMGLDIRDRWSVGGTALGEPQQPRELGLDLPAQGLYLREDVDIRCNVLMTAFVKKTLKKSHGALVVKLAEKAAAVEKAAGSGSGPSSDRSSAAPSLLQAQSSSSSSLPHAPSFASAGQAPSSSSSGGHTPRARSMDRPQHVDRPAAVTSISTSGFIPYHVPPPLRSPPDQHHPGGGYLFPRDDTGQVAWQSLTTKQQQQRIKEEERRESDAARHARSHSQPPLTPVAQTISPLEMLQYELAAGAAPVELDAPLYPASDAYADISSRTPFDDKTPDTPSEQKPFDDGPGAADAWAQRHPSGLLPVATSGPRASPALPPPDHGQQRHPSVLRPGSYAIARKPVAPSGLL